MASHFFQESLFNMGHMIPITEEVQSPIVYEAFVVDVESKQLALALEKEQSNVEAQAKEEVQLPLKAAG